MTTVTHNGCQFSIVRYNATYAIIEIKPLGGTFTSGQPQYVKEKIHNIGCLKDWVKDNY